MLPFLSFLKRANDRSLRRYTKAAEGIFGWSVEADLTKGLRGTAGQ
jgi:hypothetical protein